MIVENSDPWLRSLRVLVLFGEVGDECRSHFGAHQLAGPSFSTYRQSILFGNILESHLSIGYVSGHAQSFGMDPS